MAPPGSSDKERSGAPRFQKKDWIGLPLATAKSQCFPFIKDCDSNIRIWLTRENRTQIRTKDFMSSKQSSLIGCRFNLFKQELLAKTPTLQSCSYYVWTKNLWDSVNFHWISEIFTDSSLEAVLLRHAFSMEYCVLIVILSNDFFRWAL